MKAAIYNPYLDTLGGGERYSMAVAKYLLNKGYVVDVEWKDQKIKGKLEDRFGINLENINFVESIKRGDGYDLCFWISDGSIPTLKARKNILHFQVPFKGVNGKTLINRMKLFRISKIVCNSNFTKQVIDNEYGVNSVFVYPPVDTEGIKPKRKENTILFVGRFSQLKQVKGQNILIDCFKKFVDKGYSNWKLILAGGTEVGVSDYLEQLTKQKEGYSIEIIKGPDYKMIKDLYGKARIYWSAVGFGQDDVKEPDKVEHFGISIVEAMASGAVPIVYNAGGHKEIINNGVTGYVWNTPQELVKLTCNLIDKNAYSSITKNLGSEIQKYSYQNFYNNLAKII
jgi:glycosyltransferase involved in cell wall biosynthesis